MMHLTRDGKLIDASKINITGCNPKNQITKDYFYFLGGLSDPRIAIHHKRNGSHSYETYHLFDVLK